MSSEIFELMKRPDERAVVEKAHRRPRFVEDCVREMLRAPDPPTPDLDPNAFVLARQENLETIHQHNVVAERYGLFGEITAELESGRHSPRHVTMREWLESPSPRIALEPRAGALLHVAAHAEEVVRAGHHRRPRRPRRAARRRRAACVSNAITAKIAATCRIGLRLPEPARPRSRRRARPRPCAAS